MTLYGDGYPFINVTYDSKNFLYYIGAIFGGFSDFMDVWQMPMFFFLSGISAFYALYRRSEQQFREERTHRLLVPWLLLASLHGVYSIAFFAPRTPYCEQYYEHGKVTNNESLTWSYCEMEQPYTKNVTFPEYLMKQYTGKPDAGQGWFLLYLFLYSQVIQRKAHLCWNYTFGAPDLLQTLNWINEKFNSVRLQYVIW